MQLRIEPDGIILGLYDERLDLSQLGPMEIHRASQVEPQGSTWTVDMGPSGGPMMEGFAKRSTAIQAEVDWLNAHRL